jgi:hypothetical protein
MAIRALNSVVVANYDTASTASWQAGMVLARDTTSGQEGKVRLAQRCNSATGVTGGIAGLSADDTARSGNTMILADPVGSSYVDSSGVLQANNNGFYVVSKRAIGDFQAENVNGVTNPTAGSSGYEGPRRGVGVFNTPGGQFVTDMFLSTGNNLTNGINADTTGGTFAPGALLTVSAVLANAGKIIELSATHANAATGNTFPVVGVVDRYDSAAGLLYFTQR